MNAILGGGITGLAAGYATGFPVYEACPIPGGICSSYYVRPGSWERLIKAPEDGNAYRFEIGGGHWIFGVDPEILKVINIFTTLKRYSRRSSVYFSEKNLFVPYPLQNNLRFLDEGTADKIIDEISVTGERTTTMEEWLISNFGPSLCEMFFYPFHRRYTAGLYERIAPQDAYKSPVDLKDVRRGIRGEVSPAGYNAMFVYPEEGMDVLIRRMAERCRIYYEKRVLSIDVENKKIRFLDNSVMKYDKIISTLPLDKMVRIAGIDVEEEAFPYTSVLVLNIGALRGAGCPDDHWLYVPSSETGFHRVGFYSNVDTSFLPLLSARGKNKVSLYVERSFNGGAKPSQDEIEIYSRAVVEELKNWEFITETEVIDATWVDAAYTWSWPGSKWKEEALDKLERHDIFQIGRYGRWHFQGIAESIKEGLAR
ncbi:MAG: FAD-dependent oxidoreductase [Candidatus Omnitrophota bacterium]